MADDGGDVKYVLFRNNSSQRKSLKSSKILLTTCLVLRRSTLIRRAMPYIQNKKPTHPLTV